MEVRQGDGLNLDNRITSKGTILNTTAHQLIEYVKGGVVLFRLEVVMERMN